VFFEFLRCQILSVCFSFVGDDDGCSTASENAASPPNTGTIGYVLRFLHMIYYRVSLKWDTLSSHIIIIKDQRGNVGNRLIWDSAVVNFIIFNLSSFDSCFYMKFYFVIGRHDMLFIRKMRTN
jgi:hypothetical protein